MYRPFFHRGNLIKILFLLLLSNCVFAQLNVTPDQPDSYYEVGETAIFNITSNNSGTVNYTLKYDNFAPEITSGTFNISAGQTITITHQATEPGIIICDVAQSGNTATTAVAFSPYDIEAFVDEPADFDNFWSNQKNILSGIPIDPQLSFFSNNDYSTTYRINLANIDNRKIYGYLTIPDGQGPFPAFVTLPPFGSVANMALPETQIPERANTISLTITIHNAEPDVVDPNAYEPNDITDKNELYYKYAILAGVRCIDYLFTRSDFDGVNLGIMGVSQGAGLSTIVAGVDNRVKYLIMSNPVLSQNTGLQFDRAGGFPNYINASRIEVGTAAHETLVSDAIRYYDAIYFARRFKGISWTLISYEDVITPAATSFATFNALGGQKILTHSLNLGHAHPSDFWIGRFDLLRRFIPAAQNPPFPYASTTQGYYINAGDDISVGVNNLNVANLSGTIEYNTTINPSFDLQWKKISGPGDVNFSNPNSYNTTATFSAEGEYILQLQADDYSNDLNGQQKYYTIMDDIKVTVGNGTIGPVLCNSPQNLSIGKSTAQSSTQSNGASSRAVDGNTNGGFWSGQSVALTTWSNQPWWDVDLGEISNIENINIWNRTDCCGEFFKDYYVFVSDEPFASNDLNATLSHSGVTNFFNSNIAGSPTSINIGQSGRYIRIQLSGSGFMGIAEVEVLGCPSDIISQQAQTISFDAIPNKLTTDNPFSINATATSGLPVSFELVSGPASINGNTVNLNGISGTVTIKATQIGDSNFLPAPEVTQSFEVIEPISIGCDNPQNIAQGKPTNQSSTQSNGESNNAVDGNTNGAFWGGNSVSLTNWSNQPWWEVDLGSVTNLEEIKLWNRTDCCAEFFSKFYVLVSNEPFTSSNLDDVLNNQSNLSTFYYENIVGTSTAINLDVEGRYVRIQLAESGFLGIAEVEILSCDNPTTLEDQSIFFDFISNKVTTDLPFPLNANSTSGLPVTFEVVSGPVTINGNIVTINGTPGSVSIKASQAGNNQYAPALSIFRTFEIEEIVINCPTPTNLALNKATQQSGTQVGATSFRAVDGNTDGNFWISQSVTNTNWQSEAWWEVDLGANADIETINVWNRTDCCMEGLSQYHILISKEPFVSTNLNTTLNQPGVLSFYKDESAGTPTTLNIGETGRYLRLQLQGSGFITLAEFEVMGCLQSGGFNTPQTNYSSPNQSLMIYPNPAENYVKIDTKSYIGDKLEISIFNSLGTLLIEKSIEEVAEGFIEISTNQLDGGAYYVKLKSVNHNDMILPLMIIRN